MAPELASNMDVTKQKKEQHASAIALTIRSLALVNARMQQIANSN